MSVSDSPSNIVDLRPLKRSRKIVEEGCSSSRDALPFDHIFIADGLVKKDPIKKPPLSCAECRRLKLKCDRVFPCKSCSKRGCAEICPSGVLVSGKGTRFILANTEQLHTKIIQMSDRIRNLEQTVQTLQSKLSSERHPMLAPDLLQIKSALGLYGGTQKGTDYPSPSAGAPSDQVEQNKSVDEDMQQLNDESSIRDIPMPVTPPGDQREQNSSVQDIVQTMEVVDLSSDESSARDCHLESAKDDACFPHEIMELSHQFPIFKQISPDVNLPLRQRIRGMLPPQPQALHLWEQVRQNALWQYNPHPNESFMPTLVHHVYISSVEDLCPRRLALFLMICAVGCLVDLNRPSDSPDAEKYHHLARASLSEIPVMEHTNVDVIVALFYMTWYLLVFSDEKKAAGYAWGLMGLTAKLSHSIGLHYDGTKSKVIPEEVEKRRALFWELMYLDARLSLWLGRPPSLFLSHMDCKRPSYIPDAGSDPLESLHHYQEWKHSCYIQCLSPVLEVTSSPSLEYSKVIELDRTIRDFYIPPVFRKAGVALSRPSIMQKASLSTALETVLLQLHRTFFTRALSGPEEAFNRRHKYAPSVVAVFLSASRMIATVEALYRQEPELTSRILGYWSNAFSAAMALCLLVSRAPFTCLTPAALLELERARVLFTSAKERCPRASEVLHILESMVNKAIDIYVRWANDQDEPNLALRHADDVREPPQRTRSALDYAKAFMSGSKTPDSFANAHPSLSQCIAEVHQRALKLFPLRKQCQCSTRSGPSEPSTSSLPFTPPSTQGTPPQHAPPLAPVLPDLYQGDFRIKAAIVSPNPPSLPSPKSRMDVVGTLNFDFGAINSSWKDPSWMAWF